MSDDVNAAIPRLNQDRVTPDLKSIKTGQGALTERLDAFEASLHRQIEMLSRQSELQFQALLLSLEAIRA